MKPAAPMTDADRRLLHSFSPNLLVVVERWIKALTDMKARAEAAEAESARLRVLLKDCADDLEEWVRDSYAGTTHYPMMALRMSRDMDNVNKARAALNP